MDFEQDKVGDILVCKVTGVRLNQAYRLNHRLKTTLLHHVVIPKSLALLLSRVNILRYQVSQLVGHLHQKFRSLVQSQVPVARHQHWRQLIGTYKRLYSASDQVRRVVNVIEVRALGKRGPDEAFLVIDRDEHANRAAQKEQIFSMKLELQLV